MFVEGKLQWRIRGEFRTSSAIRGNEELPPQWMLRERLAAFVPFVSRPVTDTEDDATTEFAQPDDHWIDIDIIRNWLQVCGKTHGQGCQSTQYHDDKAGQGPVWLIDVQQGCLVLARPEMRYFALSYVWGRSSTACTLKSNLALLQTPDALKANSPTCHVPKTVAHVMQLTELLGERYLWVDRFCIVQDDVSEQSSQLNNMGNIYTNAVATIVAAQGDDAEDGLKGIRNVTAPRSLPRRPADRWRYPRERSPIHQPPQSTRSRDEYAYPNGFQLSTSRTKNLPASRIDTIKDQLDFIARHKENLASDSDLDMPFEFGDADLDHPPEDTSSVFAPLKPRPKTSSDILVEQALSLMQSAWYSRGWTFQEQIFSRRKIVLQDETVNWECLCSAWHESQRPVCADGASQGVSGGQRVATEVFGLDNHRWPDFYRFARLVSLFNQRRLTYPEDAINAFAGVMAKLSLRFSGGFVCGLPQMFFDSALLWQPHKPVFRRKPKGSANLEETCLPSWSWVGWQGDINSQSWRSAYDYMRKNPDEYYEKDPYIWQPTSWRTVSTVQWFYLDDAGGKHRIDVSGQKYRESCLDPTAALPPGWSRHDCLTTGRPFFRHESDVSQEFWYPVPLGDDIPSASPHIKSRFISCRTRRAVLHVGDIFWNAEASTCNCADLLDEGGNWVGVLRYQTSIPSLCDRHEFIEISAGTVLNHETEEVSFDEWFRPGCPRKAGEYKFYNVMAISWVSSIAYRQAVGRVMKSTWEKLATEEIDVTLG